MPQMFTPQPAPVPQRAMPLTSPPSAFSSTPEGPEFLEVPDFIALALLGHANGPGMEVSKRRYIGPRPKRSESEMSVNLSMNASSPSDRDELWNVL